ALITKNFWQERMGGDPNVIGRSITLDGTLHTIVGVLPDMPAAWFGANPVAEVWMTKPFQLPGFSHEQLMRGTFFLRVVGRLKPGVTVQQARAALPSLEESYRAQYPNNIDSAFVTTLRALPEDVTRNFRAGFATLFTAVSFVLLIACSNVANLLLVRFSGRRREIALRIAIGASRTSVIRLFVAESLLVSVIAGAGGAFVAWHLVPSVPRMASNFLPLETGTATSSITLPTSQYPDRPSRQRFVEQTLRELRSVPGLESATISGDIPLVGFSRYLYARGDRDVPPVEKREIAPGHEITPGYFKTWGVPLLAGRDFNEHDTADGQKV